MAPGLRLTTGLQVVLGLLALAGSCTPPPPLPGDANIGGFGFNALLSADPCGIAQMLDAGASLTFSGTLTGEAETGQAYLTLATGGLERGVFTTPDAGGAIFTVCAAAPRTFLGTCQMVTESITARVYSTAETGDAGVRCPAEAPPAVLDCDAFLDGGAPNSPASFPESDGGAFILLCGQLTDTIHCPSSCPFDAGMPDAAIPCPCSLTYSLAGNRQ
jgi:hypothetical protein